MQIYLIILFFVFGINLSYSQNWKENLLSARNLYKKGKYEQALKFYEKCKKEKPKDIDLSYEIGQTAYKAEKYDLAEKTYQSSKTFNKQDKAITYHNLGNARLKSQNIKQAIEAYKESLRQNPNDNETRYNLAKALMFDKKNQDQANNNKPSTNKKNDSKNQTEKKPNSSLQDKKTERMLDELMKKEMETKKKLDKQKAPSSVDNTSKKDW